ncbi:hypothetical protein EYF80_048585 [Liparis tanakae]|uniref:Uncharacterized protein n=1 Tax=Liparis tanakae TaxID=230148 RepID=A0A4Z2FK21_9TELE|nr:hypothetical protein EYF80_048585 [Liparis tanakae]
MATTMCPLSSSKNLLERRPQLLDGAEKTSPRTLGGSENERTIPEEFGDSRRATPRESLRRRRQSSETAYWDFLSANLFEYPAGRGGPALSKGRCERRLPIDVPYPAALG